MPTEPPADDADAPDTEEGVSSHARVALGVFAWAVFVEAILFTLPIAFLSEVLTVGWDYSTTHLGWVFAICTFFLPFALSCFCVCLWPGRSLALTNDHPISHFLCFEQTAPAI